MKKYFSLMTIIIIFALTLTACTGATETEEAVEIEAAEETEAVVEAEVEEEAEEVEEVAESLCPLDVEDGAVITFSGWGDEAEQQIYIDSIERFKSICPNVTVNYTPIPSDFQTKMKAQMAGGTAPDVFYIDDQLMTAFAPTGQLLSLDDLMAEAGVSRDDFVSSLMPIYILDDATYALPKDWGTLGLVYIPAAFEDAGIEEPTADWTWDDLRAAAIPLQSKATMLASA